MNIEALLKSYEPLWDAWYVDSLIGEGSFGSVYKIIREDQNLGRKFEAALKFISVPHDKNELRDHYNLGLDERSIRTYYEDYIKNIANEIDLMENFKGNSNIVSYEDYKIIEKKDGIGWHILIRMELLIPLTDYMRSHEIRPVDIAKIGIDLCAALDSCERYNVVHRDIKDANIFVTKTGNYKLGDFGIAKELSKTGRAASSRGTPLYMAPEVYKGWDYNLTADIYSLGVVLYKFCNKGRIPFMPNYPDGFTAKDVDKAIEMRLRGDQIPEPIDADAQLSEIIVKACHYDPMMRYQTPLAFKEALESYYKTFKVEATGPIYAVKPEENNETHLLSQIVHPANETVLSVSQTDGFSGSARLNETEFANQYEKTEPEPKPDPEPEPEPEPEPDKKIFVLPKWFIPVGALIGIIIILVIGTGMKKSGAEKTINQTEAEAITMATTESVSEVPLKSVSWRFSEPAITLEEGTSKTLTFETSETVNHEEFLWRWVSSNEDIATVDEKGIVSAIGIGKTAIKAESLSQEGLLCLVEVTVTDSLSEVVAEVETTQVTNEPTTQSTTQTTTQTTTSSSQPTTEPKTEARTTQAVIDEVTFADASIEAAVRKIISKPNGIITKEDTRNVFLLDVTDQNVSSLEGVEQLTRLVRINISYNNISDISALSKLSGLTFVNIKNNNISDVSPLSKLTQLKELYLVGNPISNYDVLDAIKEQLENKDFN